MQVLFIILAILALLLWWVRSRGPRQPAPQRAKPLPAAAVAMEPEPPPPPDSDVKFRMRGERGMGGPIYGDVLCSDGVYLPNVWESDFHTSFDGRWIRTGSYGESTPRLLDRKSRCSWLMSVAEASLVDDLHWRLPRWNGESQGGDGVAAEGRHVLSDGIFEAWLAKHVSGKAQALVGVCDLWIPADCVPVQAQAIPPAIAQQDNAVVQVAVQRHWPISLRVLDDPLEPLLHPQWQLQINGEPQQWTIDSQSPFVWRPDGQAFASYGYPVTDSAHKPKMRLGVWSLALGRQQWSYWMPEDRKPWTVNLHLPQEAAGYPALSWEGEELLQCVEMDTPQLERLHDGRSIACVVGDGVQGRVQHRPDGRPLVKPLPVRLFRWRRDLHNPLHWEAQSLPVAGQCLSWSLVHEAKDEPGATPAYAVQWGEHQLPGLWELEHLVVDGQWALLCPWGPSPLQGAKPVPWVWDGKQLNAIEMHWPVLRMRPHLQRGRAQLLVLVGCGPDNSNHGSNGLWRWPLQVADEVNLVKPGWTPAYEWREVGVNAQGVWKLLPRWREVRQIQHPCADGDYVWRLPASHDAAWWWGGLTNHMNNEWAPEAARCEGVLVTQSGAVLCGVGPSVCPHYAGDGWLVLEWLARGQQNEPHHWKLHWLRPHKHEVWTLELRAFTPVVQGWDAQQGVQWMDEGLPVAEAATQESAAPAPEIQYNVIAPMRWESAQLDVLKQSGGGLWIRKQDAVYADAIVLRDDWPWVRAPAAVRAA